MSGPIYKLPGKSIIKDCGDTIGKKYINTCFFRCIIYALALVLQGDEISIYISWLALGFRPAPQMVDTFDDNKAIKALAKRYNATIYIYVNITGKHIRLSDTFGTGNIKIYLYNDRLHFQIITVNPETLEKVSENDIDYQEALASAKESQRLQKADEDSSLELALRLQAEESQRLQKADEDSSLELALRLQAEEDAKIARRLRAEKARSLQEEEDAKIARRLQEAEKARSLLENEARRLQKIRRLQNDCCNDAAIAACLAD